VEQLDGAGVGVEPVVDPVGEAGGFGGHVGGVCRVDRGGRWHVCTVTLDGRGVKGVWTFRPEILYAAAMEPTATAAPEDVSGHSGHATIPDMPTPHNCRCTPVAPNDIATRLGIPVDTVNKWRQRGG